MITADSILPIDAGSLPEFASVLASEDIAKLIGWLNEKEDKIRYRSFLLLQHRSSASPDVYPYWEDFRAKLKNDNSYQRSIGIMLLAENARWDTGGQAKEALDDCFSLLSDERPITIRQCIQSLENLSGHNLSWVTV
ncbi:hypothetical protein [Papillibacter cinnamivorans]|uniref:HEAT repeat-containing protein n=1 Tax=Papillibacter cinnamivorans DSM 12816 TaxID=1122930 RepID=A0A1W2B6W3_9FIRM|nr:hypothetical protein [Papillibacter cinnamivorans]SMC68669.1 hypothetical protein SAMN02745168_2051 [Papillibacter cinnamivorans DSM 12816]